jgi:hypothetical protein
VAAADRYRPGELVGARQHRRHLGQRGDIPTPGDFDGDSRSDLAAWTPTSGEWTIQGSPTLSYWTVGDIALELPAAIRMTQLQSR